ncbi:putative quinol monooxygenase [Micromonospora radicis]|uniref:ABM domain-containing protein n=1 Tax=Micromonospora radicis TaxID=1894971 RepID=A0A418MXC2_9ACTN|nr:antibiotic biosynthesis monooxygenase family protein [Micromonospora radicis]RIV39208.1 hypothetical protein D2L64_10180 [Micromonospora radicis]
MSEPQVRLCISFAVLPGRASAYLQAWAPHRAKALADPGCLQYELFASLGTPERLVLLELWRDRAAFDEHWHRELSRQAGGAEHRDPTVEAVAEIYWERTRYRWNVTTADWDRVSLPKENR